MCRIFTGIIAGQKLFLSHLLDLLQLLFFLHFLPTCLVTAQERETTCCCVYVCGAMPTRREIVRHLLLLFERYEKGRAALTGEYTLCIVIALRYIYLDEKENGKVSDCDVKQF